MKAPFPYFGGKRTIAETVWRAFGRPKQYIEPFCGSAAVLLSAHEPASLEVIGDANGFICVAPDTRILRRDLTWTRAGDLVPEDDLLAFDEHNPGTPVDGGRSPTRYRRWQHAQVLAAPRAQLECYRLIFDDGTEVVASENHSWLSGSCKTGSNGRAWRWVRTRSLLAGSKQRSWILKLAPVVSREETWDAGWMAGVLDGEGHIGGQPGLRLGVSQNAGTVLSAIEAWLTMHGFDHRVGMEKACAQVAVRGGIREILRLLMLTRPRRLLEKFDGLIESASLYGRDHHVAGLVAKERVGIKEVVALSTTTRTFVAEGLASHNCNFWRATVNQAEEVARWADFPVSHVDLGARHVWMMDPQRRVDLGAALQDPNWPGDAKLAGWWLWGQCAWIGSGWCEWTGKVPHVSDAGRGIQATGQVPHVGNAGMGIQATGQVPHVGNAGMGIQATGQVPHVSDAGMGAHEPWTSSGRVAMRWLRELANRLERVRVVHGSWDRCLNSHYGAELTAIFLDPPYKAYEKLYGVSDPVAAECEAWARGNAGLRVALCGHRGDYDLPGWTEHEWDRGRLTYSGGETTAKECVWFSPACLSLVPAQSALFG